MLQIQMTDYVPSIDEAIGILNRNNREIGVCLDYDRLLEYYAYYVGKANRIKKSLAKIMGITFDSAKELNKNIFAEFLVKKAGVRTGLLLTDTGNYSMSEESITSAIDTGLYDETRVKLMKMYISAESLSKQVSLFWNIIVGWPVCKGILTFDKHRMILCKPLWSSQNTGRIAMADPAIQNIAKGCQDVITVPQGYVKVYADSGQIEPRITYSHFIKNKQIKKLISLYDDAYFGLLHYCTMDMADIQSGRMDFEKHEVTAEMKDMRNKLKTWGNAVMYDAHSNPDNDPLRDAYIKRVGGSKERLEWVNEEIMPRVLAGETIVTTPFGTKIDITKGPSELKYIKSGDKQRRTERYLEHLKRVAINAPIQGGAADLMRISVMTADRLFLRKAPNSRIMCYVHDSGCHAVSEDEYPLIEKELLELNAYQVYENGEAWIPINSEAVIGWTQSGALPRLVI